MTPPLTMVAFEAGVAAHRNLGFGLNVLTALIAVAQCAGAVRWRAVGDALAYCVVLSASAALVATAPWVARNGSWCSDEISCLSYSVMHAWPLAVAWAFLGARPLRYLWLGHRLCAREKWQHGPHRDWVWFAMVVAAPVCAVAAVLSLSVGVGTLVVLLQESGETSARLAVEALQRSRGASAVLIAYASWIVSSCCWLGALVVWRIRTPED